MLWRHLPWISFVHGVVQKVVPICGVVPVYKEDFPRFPLMMASLAQQTVKPAEVNIVVNVALSENYNGMFMAPNAKYLDFKNMTGLMNLPQDEVEQDALQAIFSQFGAVISDALVNIPSVRIWTRNEEHSDESNRIFGISKCGPWMQYVNFFTASDLMHPRRFENIWKALQLTGAKKDDVILVHNAMRFDPIGDGLENMFPETDSGELVNITGLLKDNTGYETFAEKLHLPIMCDWLTANIDIFKHYIIKSREGMCGFIGHIFGGSRLVNPSEAIPLSVFHLPETLGLMLESLDNQWRPDSEKMRHLLGGYCNFQHQLACE